MRLRPHALRRFSAALLACALFNAALAQMPKGGDAATPRSPQPGAKQNARAKQEAKKKQDADAARREREVRDAVAALREVAEAARTFDDFNYFVRMQSEAADALWPFDEQAARAILRRTWDAATAPGAEDKLRDPDDTSASRDDALANLMDARRLIIKSASRHDQRLADAFMQEFERDLAERSANAKQEQTAEQSGDSNDSNPTRPKVRSLSPADFQRFMIAEQLLYEKDFKHAAEMIAPLVNEGPTQEILSFILSLRAHDAQDADALYMRLLELTRADAGAGANDVILLSTPVVSPGLYVLVGADGSTNFTVMQVGSDEESRAAASFPAQARSAFFDVAASVLLRPPASSVAGQQDEETAPLYYATGHLLPFFEREAPQYAPALNARMAALASELDSARRDSLSKTMDVKSLLSHNAGDALVMEATAMAHAKSADERDEVRIEVVKLAAERKLWDRARTSAEEIEDLELRRAARLVITIWQVMDISQAYADDEGDAFERAADFVRAADVPPGVRAAGLAQAAELAARAGRRARADELLTEASNYAAQTDRGRARVTALALITLSASRADAPRVWEFLPPLVRAANEVDDLAYGALVFGFVLGPKGKEFDFAVPDYSSVTLGGVFTAAVSLDATRALAEARNFKDEEVRALALLAAARAVIRKSSGTTAAVAR